MNAEINCVIDGDIHQLLLKLDYVSREFKQLETLNNELKITNALNKEELQIIQKNTSNSKCNDIIQNVLVKINKTNDLLNNHNQIDRVNANLKCALELNSKYKNQIELLEQKYETEIFDLNEHHMRSMKSLKDSYKIKVESLNRNINCENSESLFKFEEIQKQLSKERAEHEIKLKEMVMHYEGILQKFKNKNVCLRQDCTNLETQSNQLTEKIRVLESREKQLKSMEQSISEHSDKDIFATSRMDILKLKTAKIEPILNFESVDQKVVKRRKLYDPSRDLQ